MTIAVAFLTKIKKMQAVTTRHAINAERKSKRAYKQSLLVQLQELKKQMSLKLYIRNARYSISEWINTYETQLLIW